jgi:hypothetical protein
MIHRSVSCSYHNVPYRNIWTFLINLSEGSSFIVELFGYYEFFLRGKKLYGIVDIKLRKDNPPL